MTENELKKLNRAQLLELFLEQCKRNEKLKAELKEAKAELADRNLRIKNAGSIAEASLKLTKVFEEAQKAADLYLENVRTFAGQTAPAQPDVQNTAVRKLFGEQKQSRRH